MRRLVGVLATGALCMLPGQAQGALNRIFPGTEWATRTPQEAGLDAKVLDEIAAYMGGRGCVVRHGYLVYSWGDVSERGDIASAVKPWNSFFLFKAVEEGLLGGLDEKVVDFTPCLQDLNPELGFKDREITFRHMANQISCYGVLEKPGTAFDYNDWQMALFFDTLFLKVYKTTYDALDADILTARLTGPLGCQDQPTYFAFNRVERAGRMAISPRDFCRFGWLFLNEGNWNGRQLLAKEHARMAVTDPVDPKLPRTAGVAAEMSPGQRSLGSEKIPDNQTDHYGSYSWLWWVNGVDKDGNRNWPDAPEDVYAALGHKNGMRGMAVFPSLDLVMSWNDTTLGELPTKRNPLNWVFSRVCASNKSK